MFVELLVQECDFNNIQYSKPVKGAGAVARGATGRWCIVMYAGPEYLRETNVSVISCEDAREWVAKNCDARDWCDF